MKALFRTTASAIAIAIMVSVGAPALATDAATGAATMIAADAAAVPTALEQREPQTVRVEIETVEKVAEITAASCPR